jgi:hypothetical protein
MMECARVQNDAQDLEDWEFRRDLNSGLSYDVQSATKELVRRNLPQLASFQQSKECISPELRNLKLDEFVADTQSK